MPAFNRKPFPLAVALTLCAASLMAKASPTAVKEYSFPLSDIERIELHGAVGSMHFIQGTSQEVKVVLEIEESDNDWFDFDHDIDPADVELNSHVRKHTLELEQTDDDLKIEWTIELPALAETEAKLGVGEISGELGATELSIDLGVGEVDITLPLDAVGDIDLDTGVGEANLRGTNDKERTKNMVSQTVRGHGAGTHSLEVDVGVGEIKVDLTD
jgi:hypothetical protein